MRRHAQDASPAIVRIDARIPVHVKKNVALAATIQGRSQTDFMVAVLGEAAQRVIAEHNVIRLCLEDQQQLAEALLPNRAKASEKKRPRLRKALKDHRHTVESR